MKYFPRLIFVLCILVLLTAAAPSPATRLIIRETETGRLLVNLPIDWNECFTIRYIHSVDISPVFEKFRADEKCGLVLEETWFRMFGAGMGHWEGRGRLTLDDNRMTHITDMDSTLGSFLLRVGSKGVDHTVLFRDQEINLSDMAAGKRVEVFVSR